jgi:hypothetical protein
MLSNVNSSDYADILSTVSEISDLLVRLILKRYNDRKDEIVRLIYERTKKLINIKIMYVALRDETSNGLYFPLAVEEGIEVSILPLSRTTPGGLSEYLIAHRTIVLNPIRDDIKAVTSKGIFPWIGIPIWKGNKVVGMISIQRRQEDGDFNQGGFRIIRVLADLVSSMLGYSNMLDFTEGFHQRIHVPVKGKTVFISYASEDYENAKRLYNELRESGFEPWMDRENLIPGQKWKEKIIEAIQNSRFFIVLLSKNSISKKGFVQKELKEALDVLDLYPASEIYLVPVRLDDSQISHSTLSNIQCVDMFPNWDDGFKKIKASLTIINST